MGWVFKARGKATGEVVAVKFLNPQMRKDTHAIGRFTREAKALRDHSHPNLVEFISEGTVAEYPYFVMKWIEGSTLSTKIEKYRDRQEVPVFEQVLPLFKQACAAIESLHERGIIHRDIKPANLMVASDRTVKLIDLGIARAEEVNGRRSTTTVWTGATPGYVAPEIISHPGSVDGRADIYSLGRLTHEWLTGELPSSRTPPAASVTNPTVPIWFDSLLGQMMAFEPEHRPESMARLRECVESCSGQTSTPFEQSASDPTSHELPTRTESLPQPPSEPPRLVHFGKKVGKTWNAVMGWIGFSLLCGCLLGVIRNYFRSPEPQPIANKLGTEIQLGQSRLYYTKNVQAADAERLGRFLVQEKFFTDDHPLVAQLDLVNRRYIYRFPVKPGAENDEGIERFFRGFGDKLSTNVFNRVPVDIELCDRLFQPIKTIKYNPLKPKLPVTVTFRTSIGRGGVVAQFHNQSSSVLTVKVLLSNKTLSASKSVVLELVPGRKVEYGWAEGWNFTSQEEILIEHADFEAAIFIVP